MVLYPPPSSSVLLGVPFTNHTHSQPWMEPEQRFSGALSFTEILQQTIEEQNEIHRAHAAFVEDIAFIEDIAFLGSLDQLHEEAFSPVISADDTPEYVYCERYADYEGYERVPTLDEEGFPLSPISLHDSSSDDEILSVGSAPSSPSSPSSLTFLYSPSSPTVQTISHDTPKEKDKAVSEYLFGDRDEDDDVVCVPQSEAPHVRPQPSLVAAESEEESDNCTVLESSHAFPSDPVPKGGPIKIMFSFSSSPASNSETSDSENEAEIVKHDKQISSEKVLSSPRKRQGKQFSREGKRPTKMKSVKAAKCAVRAGSGLRKKGRERQKQHEGVNPPSFAELPHEYDFRAPKTSPNQARYLNQFLMKGYRLDSLPRRPPLRSHAHLHRPPAAHAKECVYCHATESSVWRSGWRPSPADERVTLCNKHGIRFKDGRYCPWCYDFYTEQDDVVEDWVGCSACNVWVHVGCEEYQRGRPLGSLDHYLCPWCVHFGVQGRSYRETD